MDIGPRTPRDYQVWPHIEPLEGRVSGEQILSGRGLVNTYRAVALADGKTPVFATPAEVTKAALEKSDPVAEEALALFVTCLGRTAGDVALVFKAQGGVYLAGGIAQKIIPALQGWQFPRRLQRQGAAQRVDGRDPGLCDHRSAGRARRLAAYARAPHTFGVETAGRRWRSWSQASTGMSDQSTDMGLVVVGAAGRMGQALIRAIHSILGATVAAAIERKGSPQIGQDAGQLAGVGTLNVPISDDLAARLRQGRRRAGFHHACRDRRVRRLRRAGAHRACHRHHRLQRRGRRKNSRRRPPRAPSSNRAI